MSIARFFIIVAGALLAVSVVLFATMPGSDPVESRRPSASQDLPRPSASQAAGALATPPTAVPSPSQPAASSESPARSPEPEFRSQAYHFKAALDVDSRTLDVIQTLGWRNTSSEPAREINLSVMPARTGEFELTGPITVDGEPAAAEFVQYDTNLRITFPGPVAPRETTQIVVPFRLTVESRPSGIDWDSSRTQLVASDGMMQFGNWFPVWSTVHPWNPVGDPQVTFNADRMTLDLTSGTDIGVDSVAATGELEPGATGSSWRFTATNVRDFAFIVAPSYTVTTDTVSCDGAITTLKAYALDVDASVALAYARQALEGFNEWYGCYPYPVFSLAQAPGTFFSIEFPQMVFIAAGAMDERVIVQHEVAHQWWYGIVGNDQMLEPWIDEASAEYSARLLGDEEVPVYCADAADVASSVFEFDRWEDCAYYSAIYYKGAAFLDAVRDRLGHQRFLDAMRQIVDTYRYDLVTTAGILTIFQEQSDRDLSPLFERFGLR